MYDLLVKNANIWNTGQTLDIAVENDRIAAVEAGIDESRATQVIQAKGNMVAPGFVDSHMHLDKVLTLGNTESPTLLEAIANFTNYLHTVPKENIKEDVRRRAQEVVRMCCESGTTALRTHVNIEPSLGLKGIEALCELKSELSDKIEIQITALPDFFCSLEEQQERIKLVDTAAANGLIDYVGGSQHLSENSAQLTDDLFAVAMKHDLPIDFHVDEADRPNVENFMYVAKLTMAHGYQGRVSCGHVTSLCAVDDKTAEKAIQMAKDAELHIITLPSCNLYLMGREDSQPIRRGVTRIREFLQAGVNISYASDNIRDPFRPIGNGDMLEEGLLTAQVAQMVTKTELEQVFRMGTVNPAKAMGLKDYGLIPGCKADFVIFDAKNMSEALISQSVREYVIKSGAVVAQTQKQIRCTF